jgi:hypothetical protein
VADYGAVLASRNGFSLVEIIEKGATGNLTVVGYAILDSDGKEIEAFVHYGDALAAFNELIEEDEPSPPSLRM